MSHKTEGQLDASRWIQEGDGLVASARAIRAQWVIDRRRIRRATGPQNQLSSRQWSKLTGFPRAAALFLLVELGAVEQVGEDSGQRLVVLGHEVGQLAHTQRHVVVVEGLPAKHCALRVFLQPIQQPLFGHVIRRNANSHAFAEHGCHGVDGLGFTRAGRPDEEDEEIGVEAVGLDYR